MTKEQLLAKIDQKVYENDNHEVTAESVNEVLKDIVGSVHPIMSVSEIPRAFRSTPQHLIDDYGWPADFMEHFSAGNEYSWIEYDEGRYAVSFLGKYKSGESEFTFTYGNDLLIYEIVISAAGITTNKRYPVRTLEVNQFPVNRNVSRSEFVGYGFPSDFFERMEQPQYLAIKVKGEHSTYNFLTFIGESSDGVQFKDLEYRYSFYEAGSSEIAIAQYPL